MDIYEHRYEERDGTYMLRTWGTPRARNSEKYLPLADRPSWLVSIIDIARLGGHIILVPNPPPDVVLWFVTDKDGALIEFEEIGYATR